MRPGGLSAPRGVLNRAPVDGRMEHERFAPSLALEPFIEHFWSVRWDFRGKAAYRTQTLPHPSVHVVFEEGKARVYGVSTRKFSRLLKDEGRVFAIKFRPATFAAVWRGSVARITDRKVSIRTAWGREGDNLRDAILGEVDLRKCVAHAESFLSRVLKKLPSEVAEVRDWVEWMAEEPEVIRAEQVADRVGLSLRALQRRFRHAVGVSPKWVIRRYRLHEAAAQLVLKTPPDMAELALKLGYFDQPHFIRDFKAAVGCSPGEYVAQGRPPSNSRARLGVP